MTADEFRQLTAERYEDALNSGPERAAEVLRWFIQESPVPAPWWRPCISVSLAQVATGSEPLRPSPEEFWEFEKFERRCRQQYEAAAWSDWIPFPKGSPEAFGLRMQFDDMIASALSYLDTNNSSDLYFATFLSSSLLSAANADANYLPPEESLPALRRYVERVASFHCSRLPDHVEAALNSLTKTSRHFEIVSLNRLSE